MNDDIAHQDDLSPWNFEMSVPELLREVSTCLTDYLYVAHDPDLHQLITVEYGAAARGVFLHPLNSFENIAQALLVPVHSGTASLIARTRIRSFRLFSVKTSTLRPRISCKSR